MSNFNDSPVWAVAPSVLSLPTSPTSVEPSDDFFPVPTIEPYIDQWLQSSPTQSEPFRSDQPLLDSTQSAFPSPTMYPLEDRLFPDRAQSQPPEVLPRHSSLMHPHRLRNPYPPALQQHHQRENRKHRTGNHHPYRRPSPRRQSRLQAPTSTHNLSPILTLSRPLPLNVSDSWIGFAAGVAPVAAHSTHGSPSSGLYLRSQQSSHTSISLNLETQLSQLQQVVSSMQRSLAQLYRSPDDNDKRKEVENARLFARSYNCTLTELYDSLIPLPKHAGAVGATLASPAKGEEVRALDHTAIDELLDSYDIAFTPTMFLWEKKAIYLRFIGAGRGLMHRVLD